MVPSAAVQRAARVGVLTVMLTATVLSGSGTTALAGATTIGTADESRPDSSASLAAQLVRLDRDVTRVSDELARRTAAYERAQARLALLTRGEFAARADAEAREQDAVASRSSFDGLARAAYKGSVPPMVTALMSGDPRAVSDLARVHRVVNSTGARRRDAVRDADRRHDAASRVLLRSDADRRAALLLRQSVEAQRGELAAEAQRLSAALATTADRLTRARAADAARLRAARAAAARQAAARSAAQAAARSDASPTTGSESLTGSGMPTGSGLPIGSALVPEPVPGGSRPGTGGDCQPAGPHREANGFLPDEILCPLAVGRGHRLRTDAARAFDQLNAAHLAARGTPLCVTDSYRSYASQVDVFRRKPGLAAIPGRSQHGWGLAVDLCGGVQTFGHPEHEWLRAYAGRFGWVHPAWAQRGGSRPEPWHWEYKGGAPAR